MAASLPFHVTAIFQSSGSSGFGVQPYYVFAMLLVLSMTLEILLRGRLFLGGSRRIRGATHLLGLFTLIGIVGAAILPIVFQGTLVYTPRGGLDDQYLNYGSLEFTVSNMASISYLLIDWMVALSLLQMARTTPIDRLLERGLAIGGFIGCASIVIDTFSSYFGVTESLFLFLKNNLTRTATIQQAIQTGFGIDRGDGVFSEASIAGGFAATLAAFFMAKFRNAKNSRIAYLSLAALAVSAAILSFSSTGIIGIAIAIFVAAVLTPAASTGKTGTWLYRGLAPFLALSAIALAYVLLDISYISDFFESAFQDLIVNKSEGESYLHRISADQFSWDLVGRTFGLGVGIGSNRPNSFFISLLSCAGIVGTLLFGAFLFQLFKMIRADARAAFAGSAGTTAGTALFAALVTDILISSISLPDLTTPLMWLLIAGTLSASNSTSQIARRPAQRSAPQAGASAIG